MATVWVSAVGLLALACLLMGQAAADGNNDSSTAQPLFPGLNGPFDIDPVGDQDWFRFNLVQSALVRLETNGSSGDSTLALYDANVTLIESDDDDGVGTWSRIVRTLPAGDYYVVAAEFVWTSSTGPPSCLASMGRTTSTRWATSTSSPSTCRTPRG
jgi:hypothetical protein